MPGAHGQHRSHDPRATAADLLRRALAALPARARTGRVALRADAGYFAGQLARAAHDEHITFAIGAKLIAPLWRLLDGISEDDWRDAIDMDNAQVKVAAYGPDWWPATTRPRRARRDPRPTAGTARPVPTSRPARPRPEPTGPRTQRTTGLLAYPDPGNHARPSPAKINITNRDQPRALFADSGQNSPSSRPGVDAFCR